MPTSPEDLITQGSRFGTAALVAAAEKIRDGVAEYADRFAGQISPTWAKQLAPKLALVAKLDDAKDAAGTDIIPTGVTLDDALAPAKGWKSSLLGFAENAFAGDAKRLGEFHKAAGPSGGSVPALIKSVEALAKLAKLHAKALQAEGASKSCANDGVKLAAKLSAAHTAHKAALKKLSPAVRKLQAAKGDLYAWVKKPSRVARKKHIGTAGQFAVSEIARQHRKASKKGEAGSGTPGSATPGAGTPPASATTQSLTTKKTKRRR
jgi:hypothetical protein